MKKGPKEAENPAKPNALISFWNNLPALSSLPNPLNLLPSRTHFLPNPYWAEIVDGLILGGTPIATARSGFGDHGHKIIDQCAQAKRSLSLVYEVGKSSVFGLTPVTETFWKNKNVKNVFIERDDAGVIELKKLKETVDEINKKINDENRSVYLYSSGSFTVAACYLLAHNNMDVTSALGLIYKKYPRVTFTSADLQLIESFREKYYNNKPALNKNSQHFSGYRRDWASYLNNPLVILGITEMAALILTRQPWLRHVISGSFIALVLGGKKLRHTIGDHAFKNLEKQYPSYSPEEKAALISGMQSERSLQDWVSQFPSTNAMLHYRSYLAGQRAVQEKHPVCDQALPKVSAKGWFW